MGTMPIGKLIVNISMPIIISMLVQALYNVVDSIFVARISEEALTAVSLAFPAQNLIIAVAVGTGVGMNALLSRRLGERRYEEASATAENGMFLALLSGIVFAILGMLFSRQFFEAFTQNEAIVEMGIEYLQVVAVFSFGSCLAIIGERLLQATGRSFYSMIAQATGAVTNIILDPIMIFGYFGFPALGVKGAAIATVIGQCVGMLVAFLLNMYYNHDIDLRFRKFRPNAKIIGMIYKVGAPSIIMQSIMSVLTFGMNQILIQFTETAVSVLGVYYKLQSFIFMPLFGLTNGMVPIVAYNFGAAKRERITKTIKYTTIAAICIMSTGTLIFNIFPEQLLKLFDASSAMIEIGVPALRIISTCFPFGAVAIVFSSSFQALGNGMLSLIMSICRQLVIILPVAYLLSKLFGLHAVWFSYPIAEVVSVSMAVLMYRWLYNKLIKPIGQAA